MTLSDALSASRTELQDTGRENDGQGLYYYRARYYSPMLSRFVSHDPAGFTGSVPNGYLYGNDQDGWRIP